MKNKQLHLSALSTTFTDAILGSADIYSLHNRILNSIIFCALSVSLFGFFTDIAQGLYPLNSSLATIFNGVLYIGSRRSKKIELVVWIFFAANYAVICATWLFIGGLSGASLLMSIGMTTAIPILFLGRKKFIALGFLLLMLALFLAIEIKFPNIVTHYRNHTIQIRDLFICALFLIVMITLNITLIIQSYTVQLSQNQLLNEELNITNKNLAEQNLQLTLAREEIKTLKGIIPICSICKNIRNDTGYYEAIEDYVRRHSDANFSHTICPGCMEKNYPKVYLKMQNREKDKGQLLL